MLGVARRRLGSGCVSALPPPVSPPSLRSHRDPFPSPQVLAQLAQALRPAAAPARTYSAAAKEVSATLSSRPPRVASRRVAARVPCRRIRGPFRCRLPAFPAAANTFASAPVDWLFAATRVAPRRLCCQMLYFFLRLRNSLLATRFSKPFFFLF